MIRRLILAATVMAATLSAGTQRFQIVKVTTYPIQDMVKRLELGKGTSHGGLTIIPIYMDKILDRAAYYTLEDALRNRWIVITEVEGGRVPQVKISNLSRHKIYLMGGEILTGCKQDRILAADILLGPGTKNLLVPVYCVEQGRWSQVTGGFTSKQNLGTPALRATAQKKSAAAQSEIWANIAEENRKMNVASATDAFQAAYEKEENRAAIANIEKKMKDIPRLDGDAVGVVIGVGGEIASVDIFVNPRLFAKQWPKILKSAALSSLAGQKRAGLDRAEAADFLRSLVDRNYSRTDGLDLGSTFSAADRDANIQALVYNSGVIHLSGFPQERDRIKAVR